MSPDHAERLKSCPEFAPGEPETGALCQTDGHYLCQECRHIAPEKTAAALERAEELWLEERRAEEAAARLNGTWGPW